jgi:hypothetical protein
MKQYISPTTLTGTAAVVVACLVGTVLDQRSAAKHSPADRVMAKQEIFLESTPEREAQARIEQLSGVKGGPLLSLEEWEPVTPIKVDGVEVSNLFAGEFSYKRSLTKDFQFSKLVLDASFARPGTFFDVGLSAGGNGSVIIRLSRDGVATFTRSESGVVEPLEVSKNAGPPACSRFEVLRTPSGQSVVCEGRTVAEIKTPNGSRGGVFVASNLTSGEVKELSISG